MKTKFNTHFFMILLSTVFWGIAGVFVKTAQNGGIYGMQIVFLRSVFTSLILATLILFKDKTLFKIKLRDIWLFVLAGIGSIVIFNFSYYKTMSLTSLSIAAVLMYTAPIFVCILSILFFGEKITLNKIVALVMAFIGCCFVTGVFSENDRLTPKALFFGLLTGLGYSLYTIYSQALINRGYKTLTITFYAFLFAMLGSLPLIDFTQTVDRITTKPSVIGVMVLMAIFNTVIPYLLYTSGLNGVPTSVAPIIATVEPVVATIVSVAVYKEAFRLWHFIGIVLVLLSVLVLNLKVNKNENKSQCEN